METKTEQTDDVPDLVPSKILVNDRLCLHPDIKTEQALEVIKSHGFKCGYKYRLGLGSINGNQEITRAVFSNKNKDILSVWYGQDNFYLTGTPKTRLYCIRLIYKDGEYKTESFIISPQEEYSHSKRKMPEIDRSNTLTPLVKAVDKISDDCYGGKSWPVLENPTIQAYSFNKRASGEFDENLEHAIMLCNLYKFAETYELLSPELQTIYQTFLNTYEKRFYCQIADIFDGRNGTEIVNKVLEILNIKLDKEKFLASLRSHEDCDFMGISSAKKMLLSIKQILIGNEKKKSLLEQAEQHTEWFSDETTPNVVYPQKVIKKYSEGQKESRVGAL